jgi:hypothetical protein
MNPEWRRFATWGLWLSLLAAIVSIGLYIVRRQWDLPQQISTGLVVIGLAIFAVLDPGKVRSAFAGRQAKYGSNALVLSWHFGDLVVVNVFFYNNNKQWDATEDKENTLAPETLNVLASLPETVTARAFFTPQTSAESAQQLLDQYATDSDGKFTYEFVDPLADPVAAQEAQVTRDGTVVLFMGGRKEPVEWSGAGLTGALIRLMNVWPGDLFLTGHGEFSPDDSGENSFARRRKSCPLNYGSDAIACNQPDLGCKSHCGWRPAETVDRCGGGAVAAFLVWRLVVSC